MATLVDRMCDRCHELAVSINDMRRLKQYESGVTEDPEKQAKVCELIAALEGAPNTTSWPSKTSGELLRLLEHWVERHYHLLADLDTFLKVVGTPGEVRDAAEQLSIVVFAVVHEAGAIDQTKFKRLAEVLAGATVPGSDPV